VGDKCGTLCPPSGTRILRWLLDFWKICAHFTGAEIAEGCINHPCYRHLLHIFVQRGLDKSGCVSICS